MKWSEDRNPRFTIGSQPIKREPPDFISSQQLQLHPNPNFLHLCTITYGTITQGFSSQILPSNPQILE
ncbi:hypothetical protein GQ457_15G013000 [Hibiscus cannabinus]